MRRLTIFLLWVATLGGAGLLALDLAAGVGAGVLWVSVPAAAVALVLARRRAKPRP